MLDKFKERGRRWKQELLARYDRDRSRSPGPVAFPDASPATRPLTPDASWSRNSNNAQAALAHDPTLPTQDDSATIGISAPVPQIVVSADACVSDTQATSDLNTTSPDIHPRTPDAAGSPAPSHTHTTNAPSEENISTRQTVWAGVKTLLAVLDGNSNAFGPLKSAVGGINKCIEIFESEIEARGEYEQLRQDLNDICSDIAAFIKVNTSAAILPVATSICQSIERETELVKQKQRRGKMSRLAEATDGPDEIMRCYRRIHGLSDRLSRNVNMGVYNIVNEQAINERIKSLSPSYAAVYCSREAHSLRRRECTESTRVDVLDGLHAWTRDPDGPRIYWLNGMAGTGKTTVAYSLCKRLEKEGELAASFFCSRQLPDCRNPTLILPSVAYQLATFSPVLRREISNALSKEPDVDKQELDRQFRVLIADPLRKARDSLPHELVIVIDALDECKDTHTANSPTLDEDPIYLLLSVVLKDIADLPVKICVTSRPEREIVVSMEQKHAYDMKRELRLHALEPATVRNDIRTYLAEELEAHQMPTNTFDELVERSGVLFIYAATLARYIGRKPNSSTAQRLERVLNKSVASERGDRGIYPLYESILQAALDDGRLEDWEKNNIRNVLFTVICAMEPLTLDVIARLTNMPSAQSVQEAIEALSSVLHVSDTTSQVTTLHESFPDYILSKKASGRVYCDPDAQHARYARACLDVISGVDPPFNICNLRSSYLFDNEVPGLPEAIESRIPRHLFYACRYWFSHLVVVQNPGDDLECRVEDFLSMRLLIWMEIMNLKNHKYTSASVLHELDVWTRKRPRMKGLHRLSQDAWRFATEFVHSPSSESTPHIYVSALALWPQQREVAKVYQPKIKGLVKASGTAMDQRMRALVASWKVDSAVWCVGYSPDGTRLVSGHSDGSVLVWNAYSGERIRLPIARHEKRVWAVSYSPDGTRIASGSADRTIQISAADTGMTCGPSLTGHTGVVYSIAFSPDGRYLASGSGDSTIRIWNVCSHIQHLTITTDHDGDVICVAYSPDGTLVASGSDDGTIRIWNVESGEMNGIVLRGHEARVWSVIYSPDGTRLFSCSEDRTLRTWDAKTQMQVGDPLTGHTASIRCLVQSRDGKLLASTSLDQTVLLWDTDSGRVIGEPLKGHRDWVRAGAFSPDGQYIASGSDDNICIWDVNSTSARDRPSHDHSGAVCSVACSPCGHYFASGSADRTVCIWDVRTGQLHGQPLEGHTNQIYAVAYSPDGNYIASGSDDRTVRIWNALTGEMRGKPLEGHTAQVWSVAYSPDGAYLASGSSDKTVIIWNTHTGDMHGQPLQGHTDDVRSVAYSLDGLHLASGSEDRTIRIWNTSTGQIEGNPLEGHSSYVMAVAYSPDGAYIVSGSADKTIRVWDAYSRTMRGQPLTGHTDWVRCVAYSPDGAHIISGSFDCTVRIWDAQTGASCGQYQGHTDHVRSVACSADGAYIVSGSNDETVRIWEMVKTELASGSQSHEVPTYEPQPNWRLDAATGWVVRTDGARLVWLPPDTRLVYGTPAVHVLSKEGYLRLDFIDALLGEDWTKCYRV
ncbi:Vegetative incompatibility protein HET-E-1 [Ceratobasidium sp. AG-Ba]|nr:Vegetative incompatibility protein HET-E-1 [Ceratobasidium sp. AG-Ba]